MMSMIFVDWGPDVLLTTLMSWANDTISCTVTSSEPLVAGRISLL